MKLSKQHYAIFICSISLLAKPAWAFWPVFDFSEIIPIGSEVKTGLEALEQAKSQMEKLDEGLKGIGSTINTVAAFSQDLSKIYDDIQEKTSHSTGTVNDNLDNNKDILDDVTDVLDGTEDTHGDLVGQFVDQTENVLKNNGQKQSQLQTPKEIKLAFLEDIDIEEEEEEEEVSSTDTFKDDILASFDSIKEENAQIYVQTNDQLDLAISRLNSLAETNQKAFAELKQSLEKTNKLSQQNKNSLKKQIDELAKKEQELSEWGIDIVESAKQSYNRQYKEKIEDGLNNYKKVILAYLNGNVDKSDVINIGQELKLNVASINAAPDKSVVKKYRQETVIVQNETNKLKKDIEKMLEN